MNEVLALPSAPSPGRTVRYTLPFLQSQGAALGLKVYLGLDRWVRVEGQV